MSMPNIKGVKLHKPAVQNSYLGIDPGGSGGIALIDGSDVLLIRMPETDTELWQVFQALQEAQEYGTLTCCIEKVHSMPRQGVTSVFTFGMRYGKLLMGLTAAQIPYEEVRPQLWQKTLGVPTRNTKGGETKPQFKKRLRDKAQKMYPKSKIDLYTCDALLIAAYCKRKETGSI